MHGGYFAAILAFVSTAALAAYLMAARMEVLAGYRWSNWRTASFVSGIVLLLVALLPQMAEFAHRDLRGHMLQHLLLGMAAPLGLILAAPMTLLLRRASPACRRAVLSLIRHPLPTAMSQPTVALMLNIGAMYVLYLTPLYQATLTNPLLHAWVHVHFLVAGCLFTWSIAGPDAAPRRPSVNHRLLVLFISIAAHAVLAKLMYAYGWPRGTAHSIAEIQAAAKLMYYGGDLTELVLLIALLHIWYRQQGKQLERGYTAAPLGTV